jgi:hypothetical protein
VRGRKYAFNGKEKKKKKNRNVRWNFMRRGILIWHVLGKSEIYVEASAISLY